MLSCLCEIFQSAIHELRDIEIDATDSSYLVKTEGIAMMERLAYEMITGDRSKRLSRLWKQFRTMIAIEKREWLWIDGEVFDLERLKVEGTV